MKELDKEMNKILAEDIQESARYRPFVYRSKDTSEMINPPTTSFAFEGMEVIEHIKKRLQHNEGQFQKDKIALDEDVQYLLAKLEIAINALEQTKNYIDAEAYTKAWKETLKALDQLKE